jgi:hypothetical protein
MADIPALTGEQIDALILRAAHDPLAEHAGLVLSTVADRVYFNKHAEGPFLGYYSRGDGISHRGFREAVQAVLGSRGNYLQVQAVVKAYREMRTRPPKDWSGQTALTLCMIAPLLGVMAEQADHFEN